MQSQGFLRIARHNPRSWKNVGSFRGVALHIAVLLLCHQGITAENVPFVCTISDDQQCDTHVRCPIWKDDGECIRSQEYMLEHCPGSCTNWLDENNVDVVTSNGSNCYDRHADCAQWALLGECDSNPEVSTYCAVSCNDCTTEQPAADSEVSCRDENESCGYWTSVGECDTNPNYMHQFCKKSCQSCNIDDVVVVTKDRPTPSFEQPKKTTFGVMQAMNGERANEVVVRVTESIAYMESEIVLQLEESIRTQCQNRHELCAFWAVLGECEQNIAYMHGNCAPSCMVCHLSQDSMDPPYCPPRDDTTMKAALHPGDLNEMFLRIVQEAPGNRSNVVLDDSRAMVTPNYTVHIHSQPDTSRSDASTPPWVITLDHFLTEEECTVMIQLGFKYEYERSIEKVEGTYDDIQSDYRTSENSWCSSQRGCRNETIPTRLHQRMADVLSIPPENSEDIQILKYEVGQY